MDDTSCSSCKKQSYIYLIHKKQTPIIAKTPAEADAMITPKGTDIDFYMRLTLGSQEEQLDLLMTTHFVQKHLQRLLVSSDFELLDFEMESAEMGSKRKQLDSK